MTEAQENGATGAAPAANTVAPTPPWAAPQAPAAPAAAPPALETNVAPAAVVTPAPVVVDPNVALAVGTPETGKVEVADELVDTVTVTVPKAYKLRIDNHQLIDVAAGIQEMERSHAEHWWSKAQGVKIYR